MPKGLGLVSSNSNHLIQLHYIICVQISLPSHFRGCLECSYNILIRVVAHSLQAVDDGNKLAIKGKHTDQVFASPKQLKMVKPPEVVLRGDQKGLAISTAEIPLLSEISSPTKQRSRRKMIFQRPSMPKEKSSENVLKNQPNNYSTQKVQAFS